MATQPKLVEQYADMEEFLTQSLSDVSITEEKEEMVLEYLCQTISKADSQNTLEQKVKSGNKYAYIQLASWHIANAKNIKDYCEAFKYATKAQKQGYVEAEYILGQLYLYGVGCEKNIHLAIKHLTYFVNNITENELINKDVLKDAYIKLAEAEKSIEHYEKAYSYYEILQKRDSHFDAYAKEMKEEVTEKKNTYIVQGILVLSSFIVIGGMLFGVSNYLNSEIEEYASLYPQKEYVTINEAELILNKQVPMDRITSQEDMPYYFISETEFLEQDFSEIEIEGMEQASTYQTYSFCEPAIVSAVRLKKKEQQNLSFHVIGENPFSVDLFGSEQTEYIVFANPTLESEIELIFESEFRDIDIEVTFYE